MSDHAITDVDVVVLGMGPGGEDVAGRLAEAGLSVVGIDAGLVGGECPYWGCIPSKMMIRAAHLLAEARRIPGIAGSSTVRPDWTPVAQRIREQATDNWDDTVAVDRFVGKGGTFVRGRGRLTGHDTVVVEGRTCRARRAPSWSRPGAPPRSRRSPASPARRTGRTTTRSRPRSCRTRSSCSAVERSVPNSPRSTPASVSPPRSSRPPSGSCRTRNPKPATCSQSCSTPRASRSSPASAHHGSGSTAGSTSPSATAERCRRNGSWSRPGGGSTSPLSAPTRSVSTLRHGRSPSTNGFASPTGCGPSVTSPAKERSPTSRCTSPASPSPTSSANRTRRPTTRHYHGSRSPTPRWARSG